MTIQVLAKPQIFERVKISLFGELSVSVDGHHVALPASKKARALLGYLIATGRSHRRERLCELFWDLPDDPKASLRWALSKLRKAIDGPGRAHIIADRERVFFDPLNAEIDIKEVRFLLEDSGDQPSLRTMESIAQRMEDPLLGGLDNAGIEAFDAWLTAERIDTEVRYVELLKRIILHPDLTQLSAKKWMSLLDSVDPDTARSLRTARNNISGRQRTRTRILHGVPNDTLAVFNQPSPQKRPVTDRLEPLQSQKISFCTTSDNVKIAYATTGTGRPIVKAANWLNHLEFDWVSPIWSRSFSALARDRTFVRYDERGSGLSDANVASKDFSLDAFVEDLETVVDQIDLQKFPLIGISQGCAICIEYAIRHPQKVSGLILINGYAAGWRHIGTSEQNARREATQKLTELGWNTDNPVYRHIYSKTLMPDARADQLDWFDEFQRLTATPENAARLIDVFGHIDVRAKLQDLDVPTLVLHSKYDQRVPVALGRELAAGIRNAEFVTLESRNHLLVDQEPAQRICMDTIDRFLHEHGI